MKQTAFLVFLFLYSFLQAQENFLPISSYYKDQLLMTQTINPEQKIAYIGHSFFPISEKSYDLQKYIRDSSIQYYNELDVLFKKHLVEIKGEDYFVTISPTVNLGIGKDIADTSSARLFNNTRGILVEVDLFKNFSFSTALYENQNRFTRYESDYYSSVGERYKINDSTYLVQNAIVPGAARTKPFKVGAFDYAYAIGNIVYKANKYLRFSLGNNAHFVGLGHRSLFLSDNSVPAIYLRCDAQLSNRWSYTALRSKQFNLLRRPIFTTVEAYYEPKLFASHFLNYSIKPGWNLSLFEGSTYYVGDSIHTHKVAGGYYLPIPFLGSSITNNQQDMHTLAGLQMDYLFRLNFRFYGQLAFTNWQTKNMGFQLGMRYYSVFGLPNSLLQIEYNHLTKGMYISPNSRLHYSAYNLPLAHPKGNGFQEILVRFNYTKKRFYGNWKSIFYALKNYQEGNLIASNSPVNLTKGQIYHQEIEVGYRFNKKVNLELFAQHVYRQSSLSSAQTSAFMLGLRTGLINHYNDF